MQCNLYLQVYNAASKSVCQAQRSNGLSSLFGNAAGAGQKRALAGESSDDCFSKRHKGAAEENSGFRFGFCST